MNLIRPFSKPSSVPRFFYYLVLVAIMPAALGAEAESWAIVADRDDRSQKIAALVLAELSAVPEITLVERDEINRVFKEKETQAFLSAKNTEQRRGLLALVKADRILTLSILATKSSHQVRLVIAESSMGARLRSERLVLNDDEKVAGKIVAAVKACRTDFADGITAMVAVAPLVPDNIDHRHEHLSSAYQELVESTCRLYPGIAVLETDEAQTIATELTLSGTDLKSRPLPFFIDGRYNVSGDAKTVTISLKGTQAGKTVLDATNEVNYDSVPAHFRTLIKDSLLKRLSTGTPVSADAQFAWLTERAETMTGLCLYDQAMALREAALLIKPRQTKTILNLVADCSGCAHDYTFKLKTAKMPAEVKHEYYDSIATKKVNAYIRALDWIDYLYQNRLISGSRAADWVVRHNAVGMVRSFSYSYVQSKDGEKRRIPDKRILTRAEDAEFAMHKKLLPDIKKVTAFKNNSNYIRKSYLSRLDHSWQMISERQLDECRFYFDNIINKAEITSYEFKHFFGPEPDFWKIVDNQKKWVPFLEGLKTSPMMISQCLGEYGLIKLETRRPSRLAGEKKAAIASRVEALMEKWRTLPKRKDIAATKPYYADEPIYKDLEKIHGMLVPRKPPKKVKRKPRPGRPDDWATNPKTWGPWGEPQMLGRLRFKKLPIERPKYDDYRDFLKPVAGLKDRTVLWDRSTIWRLERGTFKVLVDGFKKGLKDIQFDGRNLWVTYGHQHHGGKNSVAVYTLDGKMLANMDNAKFKEIGGGIDIVVYEERAALVIGHIGPHDRVWIATLALTGNELSLTPFFEAKRMRTKATPGSYDTDTDLVFDPEWWFPIRMTNPKDDFILIGRRGRGRGYASPLAVNPRTKTASVFKTHFGGGGHSVKLLSHSGVIYHYMGYHQFDLPKDGMTWKPTKYTPYDKPAHARYDEEMNHLFNSGSVFFNGPYLYIAQLKWYRINLETRKQETLVHGKLPTRYLMSWVTTSPDYGMLGYKKGQFYKISIGDKDSWDVIE